MEEQRRTINITISDRLFRGYGSGQAARRQGFGGVFYSFRLRKDLTLDEADANGTLERLAESGLDVRLHCPFFRSIELAHRERDLAEYSCGVLKRGLDIGKRFGLRSQTVHIGLGWGEGACLSLAHAGRYLSELVEYGDRLGMTVNLENLPYGYTSEPRGFLDLLEVSGAGATVDFGHLHASRWGAEHGPEAFFRAVASRLTEAHIYETERVDPQTGAPFHVAPRDDAILRPMLDCLWETECDWWHIELDDRSEVEHTRMLLERYLRGRHMEAAGVIHMSPFSETSILWTPCCVRWCLWPPPSCFGWCLGFCWPCCSISA